MKLQNTTSPSLKNLTLETQLRYILQLRIQIIAPYQDENFHSSYESFVGYSLLPA